LEASPGSRGLFPFNLFPFNHFGASVAKFAVTLNQGLTCCHTLWSQGLCLKPASAPRADGYVELVIPSAVPARNDNDPKAAIAREIYKAPGEAPR
jgi:hypothetical protein